MATNTISRLAQTLLAATATVDLKTGTAAGTMVKQINIINQSGVSQTVDLFIGTTLTNATSNSVYRATLASGDSAVFEGTMVIPSGLILVAKISTTVVSPLGVTFTVHGMDMT